MNVWLCLNEYRDMPAQLHGYMDIDWNSFGKFIDILLAGFGDHILMVEWEGLE